MKREFRENVFNCACKNWNTAGRKDGMGKKKKIILQKKKKKKKKKLFGFIFFRKECLAS